MLHATYQDPRPPAIAYQQGNPPSTFLTKVIVVAFVVRLAIIVTFQLTGIHTTLRLSPDSEKYHRVAVEINAKATFQDNVSYSWIDNGWFRFTALIYSIVGPYSFAIQLLNITISCATVWVAYHLAMRATGNLFVAQSTALFTAFFPSFIYWSCLMLKDPTGIFSMTCLVYSIMVLRDKISLTQLLVCIGCLLIFLGIRDYLFIVCLWLSLIAFLFFGKVAGRSLAIGIINAIVVGIVVPYCMGYGIGGYAFYQDSHYFDLDYINNTRTALGDHGTGAMFAEDQIHHWGSGGVLEDIFAGLKGVFFMIFVVDLTNIDSLRQILALPEAVIAILLFPALVRGFWLSWQNRIQMFPIVLFLVVVGAVYISAATNMGALFRWKMQIMPLLCIIIATGLANRNGIGYAFASAIVQALGGRAEPSYHAG